MRHPVLIEPGDEQHAFGIVVPDPPGCFSAGDTREEAMINAREPIATWIESQRACGARVPLPGTVAARVDGDDEWSSSFIEIDLDSASAADPNT